MKGKKSTLLLLAAALILLGGFLPRLVGGIQDRVAIGKVEYPMLSQIHLEIQNHSQAQLKTPDKLSILKDFAGSLELPASMAQTTEKELLSIVSGCAARYYDAGLLPRSPGLTMADLSSQAYLIYRDSERAFSNIFWRVEAACSGGGTLELIVDDETGTVCTILFRDNREPTDEGYLADVDSAMEQFCTLYLEGLGEEFSRYTPASIAKNSQSVMSYEGDEDHSGLTTELNWSDIVFGDTTIFFAVDPHGFYTVII